MRRWTGVSLEQTMHPSCVQRELDVGSAFSSASFDYMISADEPYVAANMTTGMEYALSTLADTLEPAGQLLHTAKCEVMSIDDVAADPPRVWTSKQRHEFFRTLTRPRRDAAVDKPMTVAQALTVLGARLGMTPTQTCAEPPRIQAAWGERSELR